MIHSGIVQMLLLLTGALLGPAHAGSTSEAKCSPPARIDMSLQAQIDIDGGGSAYVGRSGLLQFTVTNLGPIGPYPFYIGHAYTPVPSGSAQTFRLLQVEGSCYLNEWYEPGSLDWPEGIYYSVHGPRIGVGESTVCSMRIEVLPAASQRQAFEFWMQPHGCSADTNRDNNYATVFIGGSAPAPVPLSGPFDRGGRWVWLLLVLALVMTGALRARPGRS